jgi:hypothetical protein
LAFSTSTPPPIDDGNPPETVCGSVSHLGDRDFLLQPHPGATASKSLKYAFSESTQDGQIRLAFDVSGTDWKLAVTDNGVGRPVLA